METAEDLRSEIAKLCEKFYEQQHRSFFTKKFVPGETAVPSSGKVFDADEMTTLMHSCLDFWLTTGRFNTEFESSLAKAVNAKFALSTNSGSSANLLAVSALTSPLLKEKRLRPGDEVITVAAGFPTTVNPLLQNGLVPVFVDIELPTYNIDVSYLEEARSDKTRAIVIAHTLGNPFDLDTIMEFAKKHDLYVIEDTCDALGSTYNGKPVGTFGDIGTLSCYPAHHITMGEGGAVFTNSAKLKRAISSFRDWGRDCFCAPGEDDSCGKRFGWQLGSLPKGFDHKFTFSHAGYNLKITDMQAAVGAAQLRKLNQFTKVRKENFKYLYDKLKPLEDVILLPEATKKSEPSWFGFPISLKEGVNFTREDLINFLTENKVGIRPLFAGNLIKQPYFEDFEYRVVGDLKNTDYVMAQTFWVGVYPALRTEHLDFIAEKITEFVRK